MGINKGYNKKYIDKILIRKEKKHDTVKQELLNKIQKLRNDIDNNCSYTDINIVTDLENAKQQMTKILETEFKGILIRSKAEYIEGAEKNTKYFANLEKKRAETKTIKRLETENSTLTKNDDILNYTKTFYSELYRCDNAKINKYGDKGHPCLTPFDILK